VLEAARNRSPVIVLQGSGRFSDVLFAFLEHYSPSSPISNLDFFHRDSLFMDSAAVSRDPAAKINVLIRRELLGHDVSRLPTEAERGSFVGVLASLCAIMSARSTGSLHLTFADLSDPGMSLLALAQDLLISDPNLGPDTRRTLAVRWGASGRLRGLLDDLPLDLLVRRKEERMRLR
jgi:hypothetical protein